MFRKASQARVAIDTAKDVSAVASEKKCDRCKWPDVVLKLWVGTSKNSQVDSTIQMVNDG